MNALRVTTYVAALVTCLVVLAHFAVIDTMAIKFMGGLSALSGTSWNGGSTPVGSSSPYVPEVPGYDVNSDGVLEPTGPYGYPAGGEMETFCAEQQDDPNWGYNCAS